MTSQRLARELAARRDGSASRTTTGGRSNGRITSDAREHLHEVVYLLERRTLSPTHARALLTLRERDAAVAQSSEDLT